MNKSELKRHIIEALTPQEADKVDSKYKEIYGGMLKGNKKKLMKYIDPESGRPNPDKVAYGRAIKLIQKESANLKEKELTDAEKRKKEDIIMSLKKQKGGKDKLEPSDYAIATSKAKKLAEKEEKTLSEIDAIMEEDKIPVDKLEKKVKSILKKEGGAVGLKPLVDAAKELGATKKDLIGILKKMKDVKTHKDGDIIDVGGLNETGQAKAKKNMDMYKNKNRLTELIKSALMGPMNENRYDINDPNSPMGKLNDEYESSGLKSIVDKYGLDVVLMMLSSGEYGDRLNESKKKQRPDYPDIDGDGDTEEPMVKAAKDKEKAKGKIDEASKAGKLRIPKDIEKLLQDAHGDFMAGKIDGIGLGEKLDYILNNPGGPDEKTSGVQVTTVDMDLDESFDSLVKKVDKAKGYTKKEAEKVAGAIAAKKMKGAGKGPTAKQKARMAETILKELRGNINEEEKKSLTSSEIDKIQDLPQIDKIADKMLKDPKALKKLEDFANKSGLNVDLTESGLTENEDNQKPDTQDIKNMAKTLAKLTENPIQEKVGAGEIVSGTLFGSMALPFLPGVATGVNAILGLGAASIGGPIALVIGATVAAGVIAAILKKQGKIDD